MRTFVGVVYDRAVSRQSMKCAVIDRAYIKMKTDRFPAIRITMLPRDTNAYGTIFGGVILSYIDLAGGIECRRQSPKKFVTKSMHEVVFVAPVYLGDLVTFYTRTVRIGTTSITVDIEVRSEERRVGKECRCRR